MSNFAVYFPNTDLIQEVIADGWDMPDPDKVTFFKGTWHEDSEQYTNKQIVAVFNMNNIVGFRKIED